MRGVLHKWFGNRILTTFQNRVLGTRLTEFHSGFRAYSVRALERIPFELNTNDFHFDTEIIIQLLLHRFRIDEIAIPTHYGDEVCHVDGMRYAWNVAKATLLSRLQRMGILYRRRFAIPATGSVYRPKVDFASSHSMAVAAVPPGSRVLDLGCGPGDVDRVLVEEKGCRVTAVDSTPPVDPPGDPARLRRLVHDLDAGLPEGLDDDYDVVLLLDILEHLRSPERFLDELRYRFAAGRPRIVLTTPNIAFVLVRLALLLGQFNYGPRGILDFTHTRLFTFGSLRQLLEEAGFEIEVMRGIPAPFPLALGGSRLARLLLALNTRLIRLAPRLFAFQLYVEVRPMPTVATLLERTIAASQSAADQIRQAIAT